MTTPMKRGHTKRSQLWLVISGSLFLYFVFQLGGDDTPGGEVIGTTPSSPSVVEQGFHHSQTNTQQEPDPPVVVEEDVMNRDENDHEEDETEILRPKADEFSSSSESSNAEAEDSKDTTQPSSVQGDTNGEQTTKTKNSESGDGTGESSEGADGTKDDEEETPEKKDPTEEVEFFNDDELRVDEDEEHGEIDQEGAKLESVEGEKQEQDEEEEEKEEKDAQSETTEDTDKQEGEGENDGKTDEDKDSETKEAPGTPVFGYKLTGGHLPHDPQGRLSQWNSISPDKCLSQGEPDVPEETSSLRRAPYFMLLGGMKCGTQALTSYLWEHPRVAKMNNVELHFFDQDSSKFVNALGVRRKDGRELLANKFRKAIRPSVPFYDDDSDMIAFDSTPRYLMDSDRDPDIILCLAPWVKLVAVLRNPLDRISSHYNYLNQARMRNEKAMVDWDAWIEDDLRLLREAGVIANRTQEEFEAFSGSPEEAEAWTKYVRSPNSQFLLGRGLYVIQVRMWLAAMDKINKPRSDLLLLQSERLRSNTQEEFNRITAFLGLEEFTLQDPSAKHTTKAAAIPMPDEVRQKLEAFFEPYNQQLYDLLGYQWKGAWDSQVEESSR